jgi:hypothetical protein
VVDVDGATPSRRLTWALALALALAGLGCESCGSSAPRPAEPEPEPAEIGAVPPEPPADPPPAEDEPPPPAEPAPPLTLGSRWVSGRATLSIANRTTESVRFASRLVLERLTDEAVEEAVDRGELRAHLDDDRPLPACAELAPGAHLELAFDGLRGPGCATCDEPPAGAYRFVVTGCDGRSRTEGPSFSVR